MARTNIAVDEATAVELADAAARQNKSLYALANETLGAVLKIFKYGGRPEEIYPSWRFSRILKDTDAIPLPGSLMEKLIKTFFATNKEWLLKSWYEEGQIIGSYLRMYAQDFDQLIPRADELQGFLPVKRIEFEKITDENGRSQRLVRVIGAGQSPESTSCTEQFLLGILSAYFKVVTSKTTEGLIEARAAEMKESKGST